MRTGAAYRPTRSRHLIPSDNERWSFVLAKITFLRVARTLLHVRNLRLSQTVTYTVWTRARSCLPVARCSLGMIR